MKQRRNWLTSRVAVDGRAAVASGAAVDGRAAVASGAAVDGRAAVASGVAVDGRTAVASGAAVDGRAAVASGAAVDGRAAAGPDARVHWSRHLALLLGLAIALAYTTSHVALSAPNERSRLYLTVAMFEEHGYAIDQVRAHFGPVFDEASFGGHFFSDKAPGASLLALIPYAVLRLFVAADDITLGMLLGLGRYCVMVPLGVATYCIFEALCSELGIGRQASRWSALAYLLATPTFHYSAAFFGHQIVATAYLAALWLVVCQRSRASIGAAVSLWVAGLLTGLAGVTEYQAVIGVIGIAAVVVVLTPGRRLLGITWFLLGGLPFAWWLASYHSACFGGPFELSYQHLSHPDMAMVHGKGIGGVLWPTLAGLAGSLVSLHRGLFATAPFLLLAPWGLFVLWRRGYIGLAGVLGVTATVYCSFVAASATWEAGWGYGCRLLIPALPIFCLLVALALDAARNKLWLWGMANSALLVALLSFQSVTALFPEPPNELHNPWLDVVTPLASQEVVAPNLGSIGLGLTGWASLLPLLLLLAALLTPIVRMPWHAARGWPKAAWLPLFPAFWGLFILAQGPTQTGAQRKQFVLFVSSLSEQPPRVSRH